MKKNEYFEVGDVVNMHCGEQGIVVEALDDTWVVLIQSDGHVEKAHVNDIWPCKPVEQDGKTALHEVVMKTLGSSSIFEEDTPSERGALSPEDFMPLSNDERDIPF